MHVALRINRLHCVLVLCVRRQLDLILLPHILQQTQRRVESSLWSSDGSHQLHLVRARSNTRQQGQCAGLQPDQIRPSKCVFLHFVAYIAMLQSCSVLHTCQILSASMLLLVCRPLHQQVSIMHGGDA
jgi:hypothetical protein